MVDYHDVLPHRKLDAILKLNLASVIILFNLLLLICSCEYISEEKQYLADKLIC